MRQDAYDVASELETLERPMGIRGWENLQFQGPVSEKISRVQGSACNEIPSKIKDKLLYLVPSTTKSGASIWYTCLCSISIPNILQTFKV